MGSGVRKHAKTRGVWGHAPPGKFCNLYSQRLLLVASEASFIRNLQLVSMKALSSRITDEETSIHISNCEGLARQTRPKDTDYFRSV